MAKPDLETATRAVGLTAIPDPRWSYAMAAAGLLCLQALILHHLGQPFLSASGRLLLWVGDPRSAETSQQLSDWYSLSHIIHGFIFFGLLRLAAPRLPLGLRLLIALGVEISWEIAENSPAVIQHYRRQALAAGYVGDSILNSLSDSLMMTTGFFCASRLRLAPVVAIALALEIFTAWSIRDNLTLNVINLLAPGDWAPIRAIHDWQAAAPHRLD
ncbi:MAG TPA: DUF2585 family protein [Rhizomicrobium sp.]|nr:DUF2585 family protein [Rhizomicrobium sp.]